MEKELLEALEKCENLKKFIRLQKRPLIMFDFETSGMSRQSEPLQLSGIKVCNKTGKATPFNRKFKPVGSINPFASKVHGLTAKKLAKESYFSEKAKGVYDFFEGCHLMAYNYSFDRDILINSLKRCGIEFKTPGLIICPLSIEKTNRKINKSNKLAEAFKRHTGEEPDQSHLHDASYDVCCMMRVFDKQLEEYKLSMKIEKIGKEI